MSGAADFCITGDVWLNGRVYRRGQEKQLQADGFTDEQKAAQVRRGTIRWEPEVAADAGTLQDHTIAQLRAMADGLSIDLTGLSLKKDIIEAIEEAAA